MLALIAGKGSLPIIAAQNLYSMKRSFFIFSLFPEDNKETLIDATNKSVEIISKDYFKASSILQELKDRGTSKVLLLGKVDKRAMLQKAKLDWIALKLLGSLATKSDAAIMESVLAFLTENGMTVVRQDEVLGGLLCKPGVLCGMITDEIRENALLGLGHAEALSTLEIGQTLVMKDKMILAVEAIEGTDECIKRGITLGESGVIICKSAHTAQNHKYDLPTLGPDSLQYIKTGEVAAIAFRADKTLIVDQETFAREASDKGIVLLAV